MALCTPPGTLCTPPGTTPLSCRPGPHAVYSGLGYGRLGRPPGLSRGSRRCLGYYQDPVSDYQEAVYRVPGGYIGYLEGI